MWLLGPQAMPLTVVLPLAFPWGTSWPQLHSYLAWAPGVLSKYSWLCYNVFFGGVIIAYAVGKIGSEAL